MTAPEPSYFDSTRFWLPGSQDYAVIQERQRHIDALYHFGEYAMFVLMWRPEDHAAGKVDRCPRCFTSYGVVAEVYQQPSQNDCPECYGTTFEGGYRAKIIRPSIWDASEEANRYSERGETIRANASVQTTHDFTLHIGDYIFRASGERWRIETMSTNHLQTGFAIDSVSQDVLGWNFGQAFLEQPGTVAYHIPPSQSQLAALLDVTGTRTPTDFSTAEDIRGDLL